MTCDKKVLDVYLNAPCHHNICTHRVHIATAYRLVPTGSESNDCIESWFTIHTLLAEKAGDVNCVYMDCPVRKSLGTNVLVACAPLTRPKS
jgi:hypothetical protein